MLNTFRDENERLKAELLRLRQAIIYADPAVLYDGRFERMIITPITVIDIARELIAQRPHGIPHPI